MSECCSLQLSTTSSWWTWSLCAAEILSCPSAVRLSSSHHRQEATRSLQVTPVSLHRYVLRFEFNVSADKATFILWGVTGGKVWFFFPPCILVWTQTKWVLAWWQSSINVSRCALQTRWRGMPRAAFPVFLNFTCACYTFVRRWQRAELTVARAIMGAILWFAFETYSRADMVPSSHGTHQCRCKIQLLPGICSHQPSAR